MDDTNPQVENTPVTEAQGELDKSNVQKRIDQITAEKYDAQKRAEELAAQVANLTALVAKQLEAKAAPVVQQAEEQLPDDATPAMVAKYLQKKHDQQIAEMTKQTQQMMWQMQNQLDTQRVNSEFAHLPPEVRQDGAARYTALKQRFGEQNVSARDAMALAFFEWQEKQRGRNAAQQFNQMGQPINVQGVPSNAGTPANLVPPTQLPNWNQIKDTPQGWKLIDEYERKGGRLMDL